MAAKTPAQKREQEKQTVGLMIELYCHGHHGTRGHALCPECEALRSYADARVDHCPHMETKTFCSACKTHCYKPQMREAIRQVMRWSGPRMIFHHPVLAIRHLIETKNRKSNMPLQIDGNTEKAPSQREPFLCNRVTCANSPKSFCKCYGKPLHNMVL